MKYIKIENSIPYEFQFELDKTALLIIDMQRDFCYEQGFGEALGNDVTATKSIIPQVTKVLNEARKKGLYVIHTREGHRADLSDLPHNKLIRGNGEKRIGDQGPMGRILVRGEYGHDIVDELKPLENEPVIDKPGKGAFYMTDLETVLKNKGIQYLLVAGVTSHVCVSTTIREANDRGYECLMLTDCTAAFDKRDHLDTIHQITQQGGIFGWAASSEDVIKVLNS